MRILLLYQTAPPRAPSRQWLLLLLLLAPRAPSANHNGPVAVSEALAFAQGELARGAGRGGGALDDDDLALALRLGLCGLGSRLWDDCLEAVGGRGGAGVGDVVVGCARGWAGRGAGGAGRDVLVGGVGEAGLEGEGDGGAEGGWELGRVG